MKLLCGKRNKSNQTSDLILGQKRDINQTRLQTTYSNTEERKQAEPSERDTHPNNHTTMRYQVFLALLLPGFAHLALSLPPPTESSSTTSSLTPANTQTHNLNFPTILSYRNDPSSGTSLGAGAIMGIVVGALALLAIVVLFMKLLTKRK